MANTNFINECKNRANANRLGKIKIEGETTSTGNILKLSECLEKKFNKLSLYGRCEQETRDGKNLFNVNDGVVVSQYCSVDDDDWITASYDNSSGTSTIYLNYYTRKSAQLKTSTNYAIFTEIKSVSGTGAINVTTSHQASQIKETTYYNLINLTAGQIKRNIVTTKDNFDNTYYMLRTFLAFPAGTSGSITFRISVLEDTSTTIDNFKYEKYGVSPSPDYPSEIECIKGINLFNNIATSTTMNGVTFTINEDKTVMVNGTATADISFVLNTFTLLPGNYFVRGGSSGGVNTYAFTLAGIVSVYNDVREFTLTETKTGKAFIYVKNGVTLNNVIFYPMISKENSTYLPYNTIQVKDVGKNLLNPNGVSKIESDLTFTNNGNGIFTVSGTSTTNRSFRLSTQQIELNANQPYTQSVITIAGTKVGEVVVSVKNRSNKITYNYIAGNQTITPTENLTTNTYTYYIVAGKTVNWTFKVQLEKGSTSTDYENYQENILNIDLQGNELCSLPNNIKDELVIESGRAKIIKNTRHISLAIKNMNNDENFPGWRNVPFIRDDYPNQNTLFDNITSFLCNIGVVSEHRIAINTISGSTLYLSKSYNKLTQSEWKEQYPNLVFDLYYKVSQPYEIDLGAVILPETFEGVNNVSNSENTDMSVTYSNWNKMITNSDNLQNFEIDSGCYINGNIIGSVYAKCLKVSLVADTSKLADKNIQAQIGVKYANLSNEYISMGKYTTEHQNSEITANMSQITAYSDLYTKLDNKYVSNIDYNATNEDGTLITRTVSDLYIDVCNQLGLVPVSTIFTNSDIPISDNPFTNGEKNRIVLQTISKIACAFVDIDADTNKIDLCWLSNSEEPDYTFYKNDYSNVDGGQVICGPINCLIIKNSQVDDENVTIKDDDDIALNGEHSIIISEDYILYDAELRQQAITSIWNKVKGMKYVDCKLTTYYGKPFLKLGDKIRVYTSATEYFDTYVLKHNFKYDGSFTSVIESPALTEQEIKTKQNITLSEALKNTEISINKQNQKIELISKKSDDTSEQMSNLTQTVNGFDMTIKDVQKELNSASGKVQTLEGTITDMNFNFSTKGLSIGTSSDSNNSLLDNTGIRVYNYNKLNAIFNNKGSGIDKLIVTGTAQIGYLKFVKSVKNNKKVTKIYHLKELIEDLEDLEV